MRGAAIGRLGNRARVAGILNVVKYKADDCNRVVGAGRPAVPFWNISYLLEPGTVGSGKPDPAGNDTLEIGNRGRRTVYEIARIGSLELDQRARPFALDRSKGVLVDSLFFVIVIQNDRGVGWG